MFKNITMRDIIAVLLGIAIGICGFKLLGCGNGILLDNGAGAGTIRNRISEIQNQQHEITNGIERAEQRVERLQIEVAGNGKSIGDCEQILARVRARGKAKAVKD